jgi:hypothetical protein
MYGQLIIRWAWPTLWLVLALALAAPAGAESSGTIQAARLAVEEAWDTFHAAAIGGTLRSPEVQTQVERDLHEARARLLEAQRAMDRGDPGTARRLIDHVTDLTARIIAASRESKP